MTEQWYAPVKKYPNKPLRFGVRYRNRKNPAKGLVWDMDGKVLMETEWGECLDAHETVLDWCRQYGKPLRSLAAVFSDDGSGERYHIGTILMDDVPDDLDALLTDLWEQWREEVEFPDSDSEFIDWLIESGHGKQPPLPVTYAVVKT